MTILHALAKAGLVEEDKPAVAETSVPTPTTMRIAPAAPAAISAAYPPTPSELSPEDTARLRTLEARVYAKPSAYVTFKRVREALGNPTDLTPVFSVLAAANPDVTRAKVLEDISGHLATVQLNHAEFEAASKGAHDGVAGKRQRAADIQKSIDSAMTQIDDWKRQIAQLQAVADAAEQAIANGAARFQAIEALLTQPLLQAKQLLGGQ